MPTLTPRASASQTITLASLGASSGLVAGRCSTAYDNTANNDPILVLSGKIKSAATNLQAGTLEVWAFVERADGTWPELFTSAYSGTDGAFTATERNVLFAGAALVAQITAGSTQRDWVVRPRDLVALLGRGVRKVALFVTHNIQTSTNGLDSTAANHDLSIKPWYWA